jgi:lysophospholipase L1-like esterase
MHTHRLAVRPAIGLGLLAVTIAIPAHSQTATQPAPFSVTRYQAQIDAHLRADSLSPPAADGILFVGSSIFRQWSALAEHMAPLPAFNRAFGGSRTAEVLHYMDRIVLPYRPRIVVYYCGSNDVNGGEAADSVVRRIMEFHRRLRSALPDSRMLFVSVLRAPQKRAKWPVVDSINAQVRQYIAGAQQIEFIDANPVLLDASGQIRGALYRPDSLHYTPEAYVLFTSVIKPVLQRHWDSR